MKVELPSSSTYTRLRLGLTVIIALIVISSPVIMVVNPSLIAASPTPKEGGSSAPSTISQDGDFGTQAALQIPRTFQSTDIVNSIGIYQVSFITSTAGAVDKIEIVFPADTNIGPAGVIEKVGIGGGVLTKVGTTLTYDVTMPVSIPAGTFIRLEISGIKNPTIPSNSLTASITTKDSGGTPIDGPSATNVYKIKRIGTNDIAVGAVTTQKIAENAIQPQVSTRFGNVVVLPPLDFGTGVAPCLAGEVPVSGGPFVQSGFGLLTITNLRVEGNGWLTEMFNSDSVNSHSFEPRATCMPAMP